MFSFLLGSRAKFEGSQEVTRSLEGDAHKARVKVHNGRIRIKQAEEETVRALVRVVVKGELAEDIRDMSDVERFWTLEQRGDTILFEQLECTQLFSGSSISVSVDLILPRSVCKVELISHNGSIEAQDIVGALDAHTHNGSVDISHVKSENGSVKVRSHHGSLQLKGIKADRLTAETANGSIELETVVAHVELDTRHGSVDARHVDGRLHLLSRNGSLRVENVTGNLKAETHNGKIVVENCQQNAILHTHNGSVRVKNKCDVAGDWRVMTHNGSIELLLPQNVDATFRLKTSAGKVTGDLLQIQSRGIVNNFSIKNGEGKHLIDVETHRGSIEVSGMK